MSSGTSDHLLFGAPPDLDTASLSARLGAEVSEVTRGEYRVDAAPTPPVVAALTAWLAEHDLPLADLRAERQRLDDVFRRLTTRRGTPSRIRVRARATGRPDAVGGPDDEAVPVPGPHRARVVVPPGRAAARLDRHPAADPGVLLLGGRAPVADRRRRADRLPGTRRAGARDHVDVVGLARHRDRVRAQLRRAQATGGRAAGSAPLGRRQDHHGPGHRGGPVGPVDRRLGRVGLVATRVGVGRRDPRSAAGHRRVRRARPPDGGHAARPGDAGRCERASTWSCC